MLKLTIYLLLVLGLGGASLAQSLSDEKRLIKHLLTNYERVGTVGRPVSSSDDTVNVTIGLSIQDVASATRHHDALDMTLVCWLKLDWNDLLLSWDPEDFGGTSAVHVPFSYIWKPDIRLFNGLEVIPSVDWSVLAYVTRTGSVIAVPPASYPIRCAPVQNVEAIDYDWKCSLKFGSWVYDQTRVDLHEDTSHVDTLTFSSLSGYDIVSSNVVRSVTTYECCPYDRYVDVTFTIFFKEQ